MRKLLPAVGAFGLMLGASPALASEPQDYTESNKQYLEAVLRAEASRQGVQLPDFASLTAQSAEFSAVTGTLSETEIPLPQMLHRVASAVRAIDLQAAAQTNAAGVPTLGVGHNLHGYANLRLGQCSVRGYYEGFRTSQEAPPVGFVPNPLFPIVPIAGATVWGGPGFQVTGSGWLIGAHVFVGAPVDVNVNTGGSIGGVPVTPLIGLGLNSSIDTAGVGQLGMSTTIIRIFGFCIGSIDLGYIAENGMLAVNGDVIPSNPAEP